MTAEKKIKALALARGNLKYSDDKFQRAYEAFKRVAHGGSKAEFKSAKAEYDRAFDLREKAMARYEFVCGL